MLPMLAPQVFPSTKSPQGFPLIESPQGLPSPKGMQLVGMPLVIMQEVFEEMGQNLKPNFQE